MKRVLVCLSVILMIAGMAAAQQKTGPAESVSVQPSASVSDTVRLVKAEPFAYCALEMKGSYDQHGAAFMNLYQAAGAQGLAMNQTPFGVYWNSPDNTPADSLRWDLGFAMTGTQTLSAPLVLKKWAFPLTASIFYEGSYGSQSMGAVYGKLYAWISQNGYRPAGPMMEKFLTMPTQGADGEYSGRVEIAIPVAPVK
jgi:DNA gyrase inhibitor GyrI